MTYASYKVRDDEKIPVTVTLGEREMPVWIQQRWETGEYAIYVRKNGCGHCCCAMALRLYGIDIDPHEEYALCRKLWGEPRAEGADRQGNFQSVTGITEILNYHGIHAECFGVPDRESAIAHITAALREGKPVIFESHPREDFPDNPFSPGEHWVMAVGYTEDGKILVANSSERAATCPEGINLTDEETIAKALYLGATPKDYTWGQWEDEFLHGTGYIIVG